MVDLSCKVVVSWSLICRVGKDQRLCRKVFQCTDLINSWMEWFMPKLVSMKCVLRKVLYYFWRCVAFSDTNCCLMFYMKKVLTHGILFFLWRIIHFDIVSAFSRVENYEQERYTGRYITLDGTESV